MKTADPKKYEHVDRLGMGFQQASKKYAPQYIAKLLYIWKTNWKNRYSEASVIRLLGTSRR